MSRWATLTSLSSDSEHRRAPAQGVHITGELCCQAVAGVGNLGCR